jgi:putative ABC transport system permease protein
MIGLQELLTSLDIGLLFGIAAIGIYLTFRTINFSDLTCDGSFVLGASVSAALIKHGFGPYFALLISLLSGGIAGSFTGLLNVKCKITDLLSGIIVAFMLYSINIKILGNSPNITLIDHITLFSNKNTTLVAISITMALTLGLIWLMLSNFGLKLRAIGHNKSSATVFGINVNSMTIIGLIISNAMIATAGGLLSQYQGFCDISSGTGTLVTA